jgi:hypothetical protein
MERLRSSAIDVRLMSSRCEIARTLGSANVKNLKLVILLCGVVGLLELIVPHGGGSMLKLLFGLDKVQAVLYTAMFLLPVIMGAMALSKPPMLGWQAGVSLAGFVIGAFKFRVWEALLHLGAAGIHDILLIGAIVVGAIASILALVKPEASA